MFLRPLVVLRDACIVMGATFLAGLVVGASFGSTGRGTPTYLLALNLVTGLSCIGTFAILAYLVPRHRFVHVWVVAVVASLPNFGWLLFRPPSVLPGLLISALLMLGYATVGAGLAAVPWSRAQSK
jgi:hypothetical protein